MKKNVILLSTKTPHHFFFINEISKNCNLSIIFENESLKPVFNVHNNFEKKQVLYEKKIWFKNRSIRISKNLNVLNVKNINNNKTIDFIKSNNPDIIFSFGISRLKKAFLNTVKKSIFNFHGGDTSFYRGLDSHLWSLYHNDLRGLKVTLHEVDNNLDTGKIILKKKLNLKNTKYLYQVRLLNTELCIKLANEVIKNPNLRKMKQTKIGRYYSFMPSELKKIINIKFKKKIKFIYNDNK
tara:strand:+ start:108 stop:824 length:717 start_codon:yes stop_codon:yes gene_type:complete